MLLIALGDLSCPFIFVTAHLWAVNQLASATVFFSFWHYQMAPKFNGEMCDDAWLQQQAALMAAATAQGSFINPMAALATQLPHALNGMPNSVVPPTSGNDIHSQLWTLCGCHCHCVAATSLCCRKFAAPAQWAHSTSTGVVQLWINIIEKHLSRIQNETTRW